VDRQSDAHTSSSAQVSAALVRLFGAAQGSLAALARLCASQSRRGDTVARMGGE
jgi:hypothetical protein